jgi:tryptophanase
MDYVIEVVASVFERRDDVAGLRIAEAPDVLRHFSARFARTNGTLERRSTCAPQ